VERTKISRIVRWWVTPELPIEHIFIPKKKRPEGVYNIFRVYGRKWFIHPIKRRISKYYLVFLKKLFGLKVIGVTGSAGKTTTKEMVVSILTQKGNQVISSYKNIDPVYNIPATILKCRPSTKYLVLEMGVEYPGEMDFYLWLAKPNIGVITNIYPTHTQFFGNEDGIVREKTKLIHGFDKNEIGVLNKENKLLRAAGSKTKAKILWYGKKGDVQAQNVVMNIHKGIKYTLLIDRNKTNIYLPIIGRQFVQNSLAAAAVAYTLGFSLKEIKKGLENFSKPEHRMNIIKLKNKDLLIDDSYNNNPQAAKEALLTLKAVAGNRKKVVVFGDMLELGKEEKKFHLELGRFISNLKIDYLIGVGKLSKQLVKEAQKGLKKSHVFWVEKNDEVLDKLKPFLGRDNIILIKGSRSIGLDLVVDQLLS